MSDPRSRKALALGPSAPLTPPLYQSAVYTIPDLDALERIMNAEEPGFIYARDGHPNGKHLGAELAALEAGQWGQVCGSGMAALSAAVLGLLGQGDRVVASDRLYGRSMQLLGAQLGRFGVRTDFVSADDVGAVRTALKEPARALFVETMSNPLLRLADLDALAEMAAERDCLLIVDNTFATPVLCRPLEHGADLVTESLTKMIGGHSDVTLGLVAGTEPALQEHIGPAISVWGLSASPFECWLTARGLATLPMRVRAASANAAILADWLASQPGVAQVIYPGRPDHPDHELAKRLLGGTFGNMLCFELKGGREGVNKFLRRAKGIPFSPSLGDATTTCSHPASTSHRYVAAEDRRRMGIEDGLIRLSVGVEELKHIQDEMARGLP